MYSAIPLTSSLDVDIIDRYQAVKRKATKTIQKCNELLDSTGRGTDGDPEKSNGSPKEIIPMKISKRDNSFIQGGSKTTPKSTEKSTRVLVGGFNIRPDSGK